MTKDDAETLKQTMLGAYHQRNDYPPYALAPWDDRNRFQIYIFKLIDEMAAAPPPPKDALRTAHRVMPLLQRVANNISGSVRSRSQHPSQMIPGRALNFSFTANDLLVLLESNGLAVVEKRHAHG